MTKNLSVPVVAALLCALLGACGQSGSSSEPPLPPFNPEDARAIEFFADNAMSREDIPGLVVGVWEDGREPLVLAKGRADLASGEAMRAEDQFRIASITKTFTATVILELVDEGRLALADALARFVGEIPNASHITIRQLLNHTSGIDAPIEDLFDEDPLRVWSQQEVLSTIATYPPDFAPGTDFEYSNAGFYLLGVVIERVTGRKAEDEIRDRLLVRLGLSGTSFPRSAAMTGPFSHGYSPSESEALVDRTEASPSMLWTAGGMISDVYDLKAWARALAEGSLLSPSSQRERLTFENGSSDTSRYGLGIEYLGGLIGHTGSMLGYASAAYYLPSRKATIVVLMNNGDGQTERLVSDIASQLYPDVFPAPYVPAERLLSLGPTPR